MFLLAEEAWRGLSQQAYFLWGQTVTTHEVLLAGVNASEEKLHCPGGTAEREVLFPGSLWQSWLIADPLETPWLSQVSSSLLPRNSKGSTRCPSLWKTLQGKLVYLPWIILLKKTKITMDGTHNRKQPWQFRVLVFIHNVKDWERYPIWTLGNRKIPKP